MCQKSLNVPKCAIVLKCAKKVLKVPKCAKKGVKVPKCAKSA